jgi:hypothetical protein
MVKWLVVCACLAACGDNVELVAEAPAALGATAVAEPLPAGQPPPPVQTEPFVAEVARAYCDYLQACFPAVYATYAGFVDCIHMTMRDLVLPSAPTDQCMEELLDQRCGTEMVIPDSCTEYGM